MEHETDRKGHSEVHSERNKSETIERGVQNICMSENNKNNKNYKTIRQ